MSEKFVPSSSHLPRPSLFSWESSESYSFFENADDFPLDHTIGTHSCENAWWLAELSLLAHYPQSFVESQLDCLRQFRNFTIHWLQPAPQTSELAYDNGGFVLVSLNYSILVLRGMATAQEPNESSVNVKASDLIECALPVFAHDTTDALFGPTRQHRSEYLLEEKARLRSHSLPQIERGLERERETKQQPSSPRHSLTSSIHDSPVLTAALSYVAASPQNVHQQHRSGSETSSSSRRPSLAGKGLHIPGVNRAFYEMSAHIWTQLKNIIPLDRPLVLTGHGVGGALATLTAFQYQSIVRTVYTYGSPAVGTQAFYDAYVQSGLQTRSYRYVHGKDVVATGHSTLNGLKIGASRLHDMGSSLGSQLDSLPGASWAKSMAAASWGWATSSLSSSVRNSNLISPLTNAVSSLQSMAQYKHVGKLKYIERSDQTKSFAQRIVSSIMRHDLTDHSPVYYAALTWNNIPGKDARRGLTASIRQLLRESETGDDLDQEYLLEQSLESAAAVFDEYEINDYPPPPQQQQQHQQQLQLLERNPINPRTMGRTLFTGSQITTNMNRTPVITPATTPSLEVQVSPEHHREQKFGASSPVKYLTDRPTVLQRPIPQRPKGGGGGGGSSGDGGGDKRHSGGSSIIELLSEEPRRSSVTSSVRSYSPTENHNNNRNISSSSLSDSSGEYIDAKQQPHLGHLQQQHSQSKLRMMMMYSVMKRSKLLSKPKRHQ